MMKGETGGEMRERKMEEDRENETERGREVGLLPPEKKKKAPSLPESLDNLAIQHHSVTLR